MKRSAGLALLVLGLGAVSAAGARAPRQSMADGLRAYAAANFPAAADAFSAAATNAATQGLDPAVALYNAGAADYRQGQWESAANRLAEASRTTDLSLQERSCYNRGNALVRQAEAWRQQGKLDEAQKSLTEALGMYERAILLGPGDESAKVNYELALRLKQELEQQQKQQQDQQKDQQKDQKKDQQQQKDQQSKKDQPPPPQKDQSPSNQQKQPQDKQDQQSKDENRQDRQPTKQQNGRDKKADEMTPEEARQLLDALRQEEQAQRDRLPLNIGQNEPVEKDW